ncbi:MAG: hypothetical protein ACKVS9_02590 [Phycisphaerae bacterium]
MLLTLVGWDHAVAGGAPTQLLAICGVAWIVASCVAVAVVLSKLAARRLSTPHVARELEHAHGIPHNLVLNAVLVEGDRRLAYVSGTAERQAADAIESVHGVPVVRGGSQAWQWSAACVAIAIWFTYAALAPKAVMPSLARIFGFSIAAPTATQIELLRPTPDERIYSGQPVTFELRVRGRAADAGAFELLDGKADARVTASYAIKRVAERSAPDIRSLTLAAHEVTRTVPYRATIGDATLTGVLTVRPVPAVTAVEVRLTPPEYLKLPSSVATGSPVHAWAGTKAQIAVGASTAMHGPVLVMAGATETRTRLTPESVDGTRATAEMVLRESGEFWIEFSDDGGRAARGTPMRLVVRGDAPPEIAIASPTSAELKAGTVSVDDVPRLSAVVRDDVSIEEVVVVVERDGATHRQRLIDADGVRGKTTIEAGVPTDSFDVSPGKPIRVWFEARDNRKLADSVVVGQTSSSAAITLTRDKLSARKRTPRDDAKLTKARESQDAGRAQLVAGSAAGEGDEKGSEGNGGAAKDGQTVRRAEDGEEGAVLRVDEEMNAGDKKAPSDSDKAKPSDGPASDGDGDPSDDDSKEMSDAEKAFAEELQRFKEKHGDDAGEAGRRMGGASEQDEANPPSSPQAPQDSPPSMPPQEKDPNAPTSRPTPPPASQQGGAANPTDEPKREPPRADDEKKQDGEDAENDEKKNANKDSENLDEEKDGDKEGGKKEHGEKGEQPKPEPGSDAPQRDPKGEQPQKGADEKGGKEGDQPEDGPGDKNGDTQPPAPPTLNDPPQPQDAPPNAPCPDGATSQPTDKPQEPQNAGDGPAADNLDVPAAGRDERVMTELNEPKVEPPPQPAEAEQTASPAPKADDRGGEVVDALRLLERAEGVTERDLLDLGWSAEKASAFVRDFERLREAALRAGVLGDLKRWKSRARLGEAKLAAGVGDGAGQTIGATDLLTDSLYQFATPPEQEISPALRAVLKAYYEALARKPAASQPVPSDD